jgi:hypothetical protein
MKSIKLDFDRFGPNWVHRQGNLNETERPVNSPTARYSRKSSSSKSSPEVFRGIGSILGSLRLEPTAEGFRAHPVYFFGGRTGLSNSLMRNTATFLYVSYAWGVKKWKFLRRPMFSIRGQRISKGTFNDRCAISTFLEKGDRRVPGSSKRHRNSVSLISPFNSLNKRNVRKRCLRRIVSTDQNVLPEWCLEGVLDPQRKVLRGPEKGPFTDSQRMESWNIDFKFTWIREDPGRTRIK